MSSASSVSRPVDGSFIRTRLGSFLAVVPLGVWTLNHLWNNLSAFSGPEKWEADVTHYPHPVAFVVTSLIALLPLALHTIWGIGRLTTARPNNVHYPYFANLRYTLQRLSAIGLLLFLGAHLWLAMIHPRITTGAPEPFADISHEMRNHMPTLVVYILGVLGVSYHLANGLSTFSMGWGLVSSRRALKNVDLLVWVAFIVLLVMGWGAVYALWSQGAVPAGSAPTH
jgi:succinate dehydrogenase / fumarate reductase cytochrome b subunit